ncbi:branched-chain amino acid ABC transporter permease [Roseovarius sp. S4756]|uniref:branched-chain amino acid ABC transporter permease n=1 Tax=Roseovarius maritimus TaxID=3342637 RepID=UPI0037279C35
MLDPSLLAQTGLNAVYAASYISLVAVGLVLIFGVMGVINFAHGELFMAGAYVVVAVYADMHLPFFLAVVVGLLFVGCLGLLMERALFRPLRDNPLGGLVASIGFLMILQALATMGFGVRMEFIPPVTQHVVQLGEGISIPLARVYVIIAAVLLLSALWYFLKRTRFGWALRASAQDPQAAELQGISIAQTAKIAMFIGAGLAGIAGALTAPLVSVNPHMGHSVIVTAFIVIIVGGVGSLEGAIIASIVYAFVHTFVTTFYGGVIADITGLSLMLLVLIVKPTGLFGSADRA